MIPDLNNIRPILEFWANWAELQDGDHIPARQSIQPARFIRILPELAIYEVDLPKRVTVRLAGTAVQQRWHGHQKGVNLIDAETPGMRSKIETCFNTVVNTPCGLFRRVHQWFSDGSDTHVSSMFLPLSDDNLDGIQHVLAIHHMEGIHGMRSRLPAMTTSREVDLQTIDLGLRKTLRAAGEMGTNPLSAAMS